ncbi:sterile alpha motif domain-containing protein 9-like [Saccostrea echinata]|uniref:sterile alpha motif domain-containing protein 9-like n=1 Tax=Saccostrea echinata TaxID=191078 RepID=UPI002A7F61AF|nr:sterile alpha motif domain-containing protein 9-like [Saccostrea echinata]
MDKPDRKRIQKNWSYLKENIDVGGTVFLDKLFESVFSQDDLERVKAECTTGDKVDRCLRILYTKSAGYNEFCQALKASQHDFVLETLQMTVIDLKEIEEEEQKILSTLKEILHEYYERADHTCFVMKEVIQDDVQYEFSQKQQLFEESWDYIDKALKEEFPDSLFKRKRRKEKIYGIKRKTDYTSEEDDSVTDRENEDSPARKMTSKNQTGNESQGKMSTVTKPLKDKDVHALCAILKARFLEKGIEQSILEIFVKEDVNGEVFCTLSMEDMHYLFPKERLPNFSFGQRKLILNIRDEMVQAEKNGLLFPDNNPEEEQSDVKEIGPGAEYSTDYPVSDKFRETFRKFGFAAIDRDKYLFDSILTSENQITNSLLETVHNFMYEEMDENLIPDWIAKTSIPYIASCLNERVNGTIHFGVKVLPNECTLKGNIIGLFANKQKIKRRLFEAIRNAFFDDDFEIVSRCVQPPQFIRVVNSESSDLEGCQSGKRFIVEIDIIPSSSLVEEIAFFVKNFPSSKEGPKRCLYRFQKGTANPMILTGEQEHSFMNAKSKINQERRNQEENRIQSTAKTTDLRQQFLNLFSAGNEVLLEEIYPILFLSSLESDLGEEFIAENFEFLNDIDPSVIFDFDSCSEGKGMFHFVEDDQEKIFKILTTDTFDKNSEENLGKDALNNALEDLRTSVIKPWVFCNGYQPIRKDPLKKLAWKQSRSNGFKEAIRFFYGEIPVDRAIIVFLLFSKNYDIMLDAADEVLSKFPDQWILLATNESIANHWKQNLLDRESVDKKTLDKRCIIGMPWKHVNEMIKKVMGTKATSISEIPTSNGAFCRLKEKTRNELFDLDILSANECDNDLNIAKDNIEQHRKNVEEAFFRGGLVQWWNLWFEEDHVLKRHMHKRLVDEIRNVCEGYEIDDDSKVGIVRLVHQPGAGGTTSAKQVLWELRKKYRCAVARRITEQTCDQIEKFRYYEESENPKPPIILIDNEDEEKLTNLFARLENRARILSRRSEAPCKVYCVFLLCFRRANLPRNSLDHTFQLRHELNQQEQKWFQRKNDHLQEQYKTKGGVNPMLLISFNMLKENFNKDYIKRAVQEFVNDIKNEQEQALLCHLSLMNTFDLDFQSVPISAFDPLMTNFKNIKYIAFGSVTQQRRGFRETSWEVNLNSSLLVLVNRSARVDCSSQLKGFCIINQLFASEIFTYISSKKHMTTSEMMMQFLGSTVFKSYNRSYEALKKITKDIMKKRELLSTGRKEYFSPLIMEVINKESVDNAAKILEMGFEMFNDAMIAQQIARLYMYAKNWDKAENFAKIATQMKPENSYLWDTYGQVFKRQLTDMYLETSKESSELQEKDAVEAIKLGFKAIQKFNQEQEKSEKEHGVKFNDAGYFAEMRTVLILLEILHFCPGTNVPRNLKRFLNDSHYIPTFCKNLSEEAIQRIKSFQFRTNTVMRIIEEQSSQLKSDIMNNATVCKPDFTQRNSLAYLRENLDNYFGENSDNIPSSLNEQDRAEFIRRRVRRLVGNTLTTVLRLKSKEDGQSILKNVEALLFQNCKSAYCTVTDIIQLVSVSIVRNLYKENADDEYRGLLQWSKRALEMTGKSEERPSLEIYMFLVLLHWPTVRRYEKFADDLCTVKQLQDVIKKWKSIFFQIYPRQREDAFLHRGDTTFFFLGRGSAFSEIVYYEDLHEKGDSRYFRGDSVWRKQNVRDRLQRVQGILKPQGLEVLIDIKSPRGNIETLVITTSLPVAQRHLWNKKVYFYVGFSWSGPKAFDVSLEETPSLETPRPIMSTGGSSVKVNSGLQKYRDVSNHEDYQKKMKEFKHLLKKIEQLKKMKSLTERERELVMREGKIISEREDLMKRREEFLSGAFFT